MKRKIKNKLLNWLSPVYFLQRDLDFLTRLALANVVSIDSFWLDLGCGTQPYKNEFKNSKYIGIDVEISGRSEILKNPEIYFDGKNIPFKNNSFDGILSTQVLEHVSDIHQILHECNRVLKKNGVMITSVPFAYREHELPFDFRRFTQVGMEDLLVIHGFQIIDTIKINTNLESIAMLFASFISTNFSARNKFWFYATMPFLFICLRMARLLNLIIPGNNEIYSCVLTTARKID